MCSVWFLSVLALYGVAVSVTASSEEDLYIKCPSNQWYSYGNSCYYKLGGGVYRSYFTSVDACKDLDERAHLADFNEIDDYYKAYHLTSHDSQQQHDSPGTWIGLTKNQQIWSWSDGSPLAYDDLWMKGEPDEEGGCGFVPAQKVGFATAYCDQKLAALCEISMDRDDMYDVNHDEIKILKNVFLVSCVLALVFAAFVAVSAVFIGKYCRDKGASGKGYKKHIQEESWM
ncbi:uncharacterized protein LOC100368157 [Saccoglossus kowalevskii]|uniref:CD209 antigen-like protein D-like n=1 Tax=Saccoglossus kowalevskii TaxID=10224 RepID=A0ABM0MWX8_SACKO|nr:PREDICTED: CD209 antigen-like protein D-like [Saccoglossus kowalevskii]